MSLWAAEPLCSAVRNSESLCDVILWIARTPYRTASAACSVQRESGVARFVRVTPEVRLRDQFDETFDYPLEVFRREFAHPTTDPLDGDRPNLRYLDPRCARETLGGQFRSQRKSNGLRLAGNRHRDHGSGPPIEEVVAEDEDRPESCLFPASHRVEVGPINLAP
jgi:hypothetical protein